MKRMNAWLTSLAVLGFALGIVSIGRGNVDCYTSDGTEACPANATIGGANCSLSASGDQRPKVKAAAAGSKGIVYPSSECAYDCPGKSSPSYPSGAGNGKNPNSSACP